MPSLKVFICHSSSDKPAARELYRRLKAEGFVPWLDEEDLLPGQNWKRVIPSAVADAHVVVVCLSNTAVTKQGFVQKEIGYALDVAGEQPEDTIFIIPVRLEECKVPDRLSEWQWVDLYEPRGYDRLLRSLRVRADTLPGGTPAPPPPAPAPSPAPSPPPAARAAPPEVRQAPPPARQPGGQRSAGADAPGQKSFWQKLNQNDAGFGVHLGFNIFWLHDRAFMAEVEIASYVDDPKALGATLVFHPLEYSIVWGVGEIPGWRMDIDQELERDERAPVKEQLLSIALQLSRWPEERLRDYLLRVLQEKAA